MDSIWKPYLKSSKRRAYATERQESWCPDTSSFLPSVPCVIDHSWLVPHLLLPWWPRCLEVTWERSPCRPFADISSFVYGKVSRNQLRDPKRESFLHYLPVRVSRFSKQAVSYIPIRRCILAERWLLMVFIDYPCYWLLFRRKIATTNCLSMGPYLVCRVNVVAAT
jgi:hypothetical protein